jgi:hypothetical protein
MREIAETRKRMKLWDNKIDWRKWWKKEVGNDGRDRTDWTGNILRGFE